MAISIATDVHIIVNGVTLSDHVTKVTTDDNRAKKDITCMGATSVAYAKGLGDASVSVTFLQDFAAGKVHAPPTAHRLLDTSQRRDPADVGWSHCDEPRLSHLGAAVQLRHGRRSGR